MKKILTLLLAVGVFAVAQAQTSKEEARRVILGGGGSNGSGSGNGRDVILGGGNNGENYPSNYPGSYPSGSRQAEVDRINREYDNKIQSIRNNSYLSYEEKERAIRQLEKDRQKRLKQINRYDDDQYDDRYDRKDNGKHKGWYKGKGNPHRNGGKNKRD